MSKARTKVVAKAIRSKAKIIPNSFIQAITAIKGCRVVKRQLGKDGQLTVALEAKGKSTKSITFDQDRPPARKEIQKLFSSSKRAVTQGPEKERKKEIRPARGIKQHKGYNRLAA